MWVLNVELAAYHPAGSFYFDGCPRFLESLCKPDINYLTLSGSL